MRAQKRFGLFTLLFILAGSSAWGHAICKDIYKDVKQSRSVDTRLEIFRPQKVAMSRTFFRSTYDHEVVARKSDDGRVLMVLARRSTLQEMVNFQYDHGDFIVRIRTPKNNMWTSAIAANKVNSLEQAKELLWNRPRSGGLANRFALQDQFNEVFESLHATFSRYKEDGKDFPDEFYRDLARWSFRYLFLATYIDVHLKTPDGRPGQIIATARLAQAPYKNDSMALPDTDMMVLSRSENWDAADVRNGSKHIANQVRVPDHFMQTFWKDLFPKGVIDYPGIGTALRSPETLRDGNLIYVPLIMESVMEQSILSLRSDADRSALRNLIEPGNFSISRQYAKQVAPLLYMHMARLAEAPHMNESVGENSHTVTYSEVGSDTHRHYSILGLKPHSEKLIKSPNKKPWDILAGGASALLGAFKVRFAREPTLSAGVDALMSEFNQREVDFWRSADREGASPGGRNLGFTNRPDDTITPVETLFSNPAPKD